MSQILHPYLLCLAGLLPTVGTGQEVHGVVKDVTGQAISNVAVRADVFTSVTYTQLVATTDFHGQFTFSSLAGSWNVQVDPSSLNGLGYLDVQPASFSLSNEVRAVRFTTRKLGFDAHLSGRLVDDLGWPLSLSGLSASITENAQAFATNTVTGIDGSFSFAVSPAIWRINGHGLVFVPAVVFPLLDVSVEATNSEVQITIVAPRVTGSISGIASNLAGFEVRAECEAYGTRYVQSQRLWSASEAFTLPVFNGVWTVTVTNQGYSFQVGWVAPPPIVVAVTNSTATLQFEGSRFLQRTINTRVMAPDGTPMTNASVYAFNEERFVFSSPVPVPGPAPVDPATTRLQLDEGRWTVSAWSAGPETGVTWQVTREIEVNDETPTNLSLVIPDGTGTARIRGVARDTSGVPLAGREVNLAASIAGTNYNGWMSTDTNGAFSAGVTPGCWVAFLYGQIPCATFATAIVAEAEVQIELVRCPLPSNPLVAISVVVEADGDPPDKDYQVIFRSDSGRFYSTNVPPTTAFLVNVSEGIWSASLSQSWFFFQNDPYQLFPSLKFQHNGASPASLTLLARQASARIEGRLRNAQGRLLTTGYASARANIGGTNYFVSGEIASGYFSLNVIPGNWEVAVSTWHYPSFGLASANVSTRPGSTPLLPTHADPPSQFVSVSHAPARCEFVAAALSDPVQLAVSVIREDGSAVGGVDVQLFTAAPYSQRNVNANGVARFTTLPGSNFISAAWRLEQVGWEELLFPSVALELSAPSNHVILVARAPTSCVGGRISDETGHRLSLPVSAWTRFNGTNYLSYGCPGSGNEFCLPVIPGDWSVAVPDGVANALGFRSSPPLEANVPAVGSPPTLTFVLESMAEDFRHAHWLNPVLSSAGVQLELRSQSSSVWRIERSEDLEAWNPWSTVTTSNGVACLVDPASVGGRSSFYRAVWVQ